MYSVFKHLNIDTYTRRTHKYKVNIIIMYKLYNGVKKKKEKTGGPNKNSTDMDIYKQSCRQILIPTTRGGGGGEGGVATSVTTTWNKGGRIGTVTTVAGGDRGEGGIN